MTMLFVSVELGGLMKINAIVRNLRKTHAKTHEGAPARAINAEQQLRRSVMACLLWESEFYEDGQSIAQRIADTVPLVKPATVAAIAIEAREQMKLRHVPLLIVREMARHASHRPLVAETLAGVIRRADEPAEFLAIYWKDGRIPVAHQVRAGLQTALYNFDEYDFAKYRGDNKAVKLRDVFRVVHPQPRNDEESALWKRVVQNELATPDTWEVALSANDGVEKVAKWTRLLNEERLGALALLRNLRNMQEAGVEDALIRAALSKMNVTWVLPFRFIAAARHAPSLEDALQVKFFESIGKARLKGRTVIVVDVSGSMEAPLSGKSDMNRMDAACGVAMIAREMCEDVDVFTFSNELVQVPNRHGFALRDAIVGSQPHGGTELGKALKQLYAMKQAKAAWSRLIVITDEQSHDRVPAPKRQGYVINVGSYKNGIGYGEWTHIDGFSEAVFHYIKEIDG
jgi:hypothetical protein